MVLIIFFYEFAQKVDINQLNIYCKTSKSMAVSKRGIPRCQLQFGEVQGRT